MVEMEAVVKCCSSGFPGKAQKENETRFRPAAADWSSANSRARTATLKSHVWRCTTCEHDG